MTCTPLIPELPDIIFRTGILTHCLRKENKEHKKSAFTRQQWIKKTESFKNQAEKGKNMFWICHRESGNLLTYCNS